MGISIAATACLERCYTLGMRPLTITSRLTVAAMNAPATIALFILVTKGYRLVTAMIDTLGSEVYYAHDMLPSKSRVSVTLTLI